MEKFSDINWSEIVKNAITEKISFLEEIEKSLVRSALLWKIQLFSVKVN